MIIEGKHWLKMKSFHESSAQITVFYLQDSSENLLKRLLKLKLGVFVCTRPNLSRNPARLRIETQISFRD